MVKTTSIRSKYFDIDLGYNNINENWINPEDVKNFPSLQNLVLRKYGIRLDGTKIDIRQI